MSTTTNLLQCYHCGEDCTTGNIKMQENYFCCEGCKMVYSILNKNGLCDYYKMNVTPGKSLQKPGRTDKFLFLDEETIQQQLLSFKDAQQVHITFYLPQIHCSSCLYLLENLPKLNAAIISSRVNFPTKEATIVFNHQQTSLRKTAELLTAIGYEPYISLQNLGYRKPPVPKTMVYQLGIAGFCFGNIMLLSFPEYLGFTGDEKNLQSVFRILTILLSLPVLFYSAQPFFESAWKGLKNKFLNIDAPIALAILLTFFRSIYEVYANISAGYFDSMSGIVFFMLVGRTLQNKTYRQLSFDREYTSYFPIAITVLKNELETQVTLPQIKVNDTLLIHNDEIIPADGILTRGKAFIDYSFVTGESLPVVKEIGELIYAGGRQTGSNIEILTIKEVAHSYLTSLWNKSSSKDEAPLEKSFVHTISRYFTYTVLALALAGAVYWSFYSSTKAWNVITTVLIVACPCALLLSNTFTNGNVLRILSLHKFYLRNAKVIEELALANHIVFDKTGTITTAQHQEINFTGDPLSEEQKQMFAQLAAQSTHPLSKALAKHLGKIKNYTLTNYKETPGKGIEATVHNNHIVLGSSPLAEIQSNKQTKVHAVINQQYLGYFVFHNQYRNELKTLLTKLKKEFRLSVLSGDGDGERVPLRKLFGSKTKLLFHQKPHQKQNYICTLQQQGTNVIMIGDGLNDAGALKQSNTGIAITDGTNNFTPASDAILCASKLHLLHSFLKLCRANKQIIIASFILSIVYNIIGLFFALQGTLSPLIAAILMPASSLCIILLSFGCSNWVASLILPKCEAHTEE